MNLCKFSSMIASFVSKMTHFSRKIRENTPIKTFSTGKGIARISVFIMVALLGWMGVGITSHTKDISSSVTSYNMPVNQGIVGYQVRFGGEVWASGTSAPLG